MTTYIQVISHVKHFWFAEVDIRKKVVHLNHLFATGTCVARQGYYKTCVQRPPETNSWTSMSILIQKLPNT